MSAMIFASCGSKEFGDVKKTLKECETAIDKAKTCEELKKAGEDMMTKGLEIIKNHESYKGDTITADEQKKIEELTKQLKEKAEAKAKELKCN